jgi:cellobiose phosphorylase
VKRSFDQARASSERELQQLELSVQEVEQFQRLLSVLLYPHAALRAEPATLAKNSKGQAGLWPLSISGDYPILLVRVGSQDDTALIGELCRAHAYWRNRHLQIDLVILNLQDSSYSQELRREAMPG